MSPDMTNMPHGRLALIAGIVGLIAMAGCGSESGRGSPNVTPGPGGNGGDRADAGTNPSGATDAATPPAKDAGESDDEDGDDESEEMDARDRSSDTPQMQGDAERGDGRQTAGDAGMDGQGAPPDGAFRDGRSTDGDGSSNQGPCGGGCPSDSLCRDDECKAKAQLKCDAVKTSEGTLKPGEKLTFKGTFEHGTPLSDALTTCAENTGGPNSEKVFKFKVSEATQIKPKVTFQGAGSVVMQVRKGACRANAAAQTTCFDSSDQSFYAPASGSSPTTYYLVVENTAKFLGDFEVTLDAVQACSFGGYGDYGCQSGDKYLCENINNQTQPNEKKFACPTASGSKVGCQGGECLGDSCSAPITIQASSGFSQSYTGDLASYSASMDFKDGNSSCKVQAVQASSRGPEVIYKVTGLQQGQTLEVKTAFPDDSSRDDPNSNLIYITNECKPPSKIDQIGCAETGNDIGDKPVTMEIDSAAKAGDYYIYIDKQSNNSNPFEYEISIK